MLDLEEQIFKQLEKSKNILIIFSNNPDQDALSSALALFIFIKKLGYKVDIIGQQEEQNKLSFLPFYNEITTEINNLRRFVISLNIKNTKVKQISYSVNKDKLNFIISPSKGWFTSEDIKTKTGDFKYDLIITVGISDLESLGKIYDNNIEFFYKTPIINIDHQAINEEFGQINFIDLNAVATSEIIFYLLKKYKSEKVTEDIATCLLTGIIYKTKNFKINSITPRTLLTTSELISLGGRREEIINHLYRSKKISTLKLWGKILNNLKSENNDELVWSKISAQDFNETPNDDSTLVEIIDELIINIPKTKLVIIFKEEKNHDTKILIYSPKNINALEMLKELEPTGTIKLAQVIVKDNLDNVSSTIIALIKNKLERIS